MASSEFKVTVNGGKEQQVRFLEKNSGTIDNMPFEMDILALKAGSFHVIKDNKGWNIEVVSLDREAKRAVLNINGSTYTIQVKDQYDELLHNLGLDNLNNKKVNELKAPMPGLVLRIEIEEGQSVKKGDPLLVLEAMKMENVLKSPADLTVKKISVKKGVAVEKNQVLIHFS
ncbi:MAG: biotin/lipoyl-containing protein [Bacteroidia bacterium]